MNAQQHAFAISKILEDSALISEEYGVQRHRFVNGNCISVIQRETMFNIYQAIVKAKFNEPTLALIVGGGHREFPADSTKMVNVIGPCSYDNYNGTGIPEKDETFHIVESCHSFEHLKDAKGSAGEFVRVCKKGGYIILIIPDMRLHRHDMNDKKVGNRCYQEFIPETALEIFKPYIKENKIKLIHINTRDNKLDFEMVFERL